MSGINNIPEMIPDFQHFTFNLGKGSAAISKPKQIKFVETVNIPQREEMVNLWNEFHYINYRPRPRPAWADIDRTGIVPGETLEEWNIRNKQKVVPNNPNFLEIIDNCKNGISWYTEHPRILMEFRNTIETEISYVT